MSGEIVSIFFSANKLGVVITNLGAFQLLRVIHAPQINWIE